MKKMALSLGQITEMPKKRRAAKRRGVAREKLEKQRNREHAKMVRDQQWLEDLDDNNLHRESKMQHHAKEQFTFVPRDRRILQELEKDVSSIKTAKHKARLPVNTVMRQDILGHYDLEQSVNGISTKTATKFHAERTNTGFTQSLRLGRPAIPSDVTRSMNRIERLVASGRRNFKGNGAALYDADNKMPADRKPGKWF